MDFRASVRVGYLVVSVAACGKVNTASPPDAHVAVDAPVQTEMATLTVAVTGVGSVTSTPAGITCSNVSATSTCSAKFTIGSTVTLTSTTPAGGTLSWSEASCSDPATCAVMIGGDENIAAAFACSQHGMQSFTYTGAMQMLQTLPVCTDVLMIDAQAGAGGNSSSAGVGGSGGRVQATLVIDVGAPVAVFVGNVGGVGGAAGGIGGYNGGGNGGLDAGQTGGGGGGASDVRIGGTDLAHRVVVAGAGGGGATCSSAANIGAVGGGLIGGVGPTACSTPVSPAEPGTQTAGGAGGVFTGYTDGTPGVSGVGGSASSNGTMGNGGGGGGGGYFGGGGASWGGGAGGSSYTDPAATAVTHTQGFRAGAGLVVISW